MTYLLRDQHTAMIKTSTTTKKHALFRLNRYSTRVSAASYVVLKFAVMIIRKEPRIMRLMAGMS